MPTIPLNLAAQSNPGVHPHAGVARLVNCYALAAGKEGKSPVVVRAAPGLRTWATLAGATTGGIRALWVMGSTLYAVAGRGVYRIDTTGSASLVGSIATTGPVSVAVNRNAVAQQSAIDCGGLSYILQSNTLQRVDDPSVSGAIAVTFLDGFFIHAKSGRGGQFAWTEIDEGTSIDGLSFASAEANPDALMGVGVAGRVLILLGERSTEFHNNSGDALNQFQRVNAINVGCIAKRSVRQIAIVRDDVVTDTLAWVATDQQGHYSGVVIASDYGAKKISSEALDRVISSEPDKAGISATSWVDAGHAFYAVSGTDWTWVYDTATGLWHERESGGARWRVAHVVSFGGALIAGDVDTGTLYELSHDYHDEAGDALVMTMQTPPNADYPNRLQYDAVWLDIVPGTGVVGRSWSGSDSTDTSVDQSDPTADEVSVPGLDVTYPRVGMSYSSDGTSWSSEAWRDFGRSGSTQTRVYWRVLGTAGSHGRSFRFRVSAAVTRMILGAYWEGRKLRP